LLKFLYLGIVHKRRPQSGEREGESLSSADILKTRRQKDLRDSSEAYLRTFWCKKPRIFRYLWCVRTNKRRVGVKPVRTFCGQGERGVNILRFCADVFYGRPLSV